MKQFLTFTIIWIANNLSIPFWMVGHIHLTTNVYKDIHEIIASLGMNVIVAIGFIIEYKQTFNNENKTNGGKENNRIMERR